MARIDRATATLELASDREGAIARTFHATPE